MSISKEFADWINGLPQSERDRIVEKIHLVQSWVDEFADVLGKKKPPAVRITEKNLYYAPLSNHLCVPTRALMELNDQLLRIVVAHECGHFNRRWVSLLAWTPTARLLEEIRADKLAMGLAGATKAELACSIRAAAKYEHESCELQLNDYIDLRLKLLDIPDADTARTVRMLLRLT